MTAAIMNAHVRDNFLETSTATATTAGDLVYADGNKSMGSRLAIGSNQSYLASSGSAPAWRSFATDATGNSDTLSTASLGTGYIPMSGLDSGTMSDISVTVTIGTSRAFVGWSCWMSGSTAGKLMLVSVEISGATTFAATDLYSIAFEPAAANDRINVGTFQPYTGLNSGSTTFQLRAKSEATNVATFAYPRLSVFPF